MAASFPRLCIPLRAKTFRELVRKIDLAQAKADIIEIWLGDLERGEIDWDELFRRKKLPYLFNVKSADEEGDFSGTAEEKLSLLLEGARRGAEYCDLNADFSEDLITKFIQEKRTTELILSKHFFDHTPALSALLETAEKMAQRKADIIKIATHASDSKDLLTLLELSGKLQEKGMKFITVAMGPLGKLSRVAAPLLGSEMMFAALNETEKTAAGQMSAEELREIWRILQD